MEHPPIPKQTYTHHEHPYGKDITPLENMPFTTYDAPPRAVTYLKAGSRIGLSLAGAVEAALLVAAFFTGGIVDLLLSELIPGLDLLIDCLFLLIGIAVLVLGYFGGMYIGYWIYGIKWVQWNKKHTR